MSSPSPVHTKPTEITLQSPDNLKVETKIETIKHVPTPIPNVLIKNHTRLIGMLRR